MKFIINTLIILTILFASGCGNTFFFPSEDDFSLEATVNNESLSVGDELIVNAKFKNLTNNKYELNSSATFSKSGLIHINLYELEEKEMVMVGAIRFVNIKEKQEVTDQRKFELNKKGKFKVVVFSSFDITDSKTNEKKEYIIKTNTMLIDVR